MKKTILILMLSLGLAFSTEARTKVIINNTSGSGCTPRLDLWGTSFPFNSTFTVFSTSTLPAGTSTFNCLVDITYVGFDWTGGLSVSGFPVSVGSSGGGNFSAGTCLLGLPYTWTYATSGATCSGMSASVLTINI